MKIIRFTGTLMLCLALGMLGFYTYLRVGLSELKVSSKLHVDLSPERVQRGKYLAKYVMGCIDCHSKRDYSRFAAPTIANTEGSGGQMWSYEDGVAGEVYAPNITPFALRSWSDGDIFRAIAMGVDNNDMALHPIMPYVDYGKLPKEDIYAVIAYLRSLPEIRTKVPTRDLDFPQSMLVYTLPKQYKPIVMKPAKTNKLAYGKYLVTASACMQCHTRKQNGNFVMQEYMGGGADFAMPNGIVVTSANISPHNELGIGKWDAERFVETFHQYRDSAIYYPQINEGEYNTVMSWQHYAQLEQAELEAIYTYLNSLKPVGNSIAKFKVVASN